MSKPLGPPLEIEADSYRREVFRDSAFVIAADDFCRKWLHCRDLCRNAYDAMKAYRENPTQENEDWAIAAGYFADNCDWARYELDELVASKLAQAHRGGLYVGDAARLYEQLARLLAEVELAEMKAAWSAGELDFIEETPHTGIAALRNAGRAVQPSLTPECLTELRTTCLERAIEHLPGASPDSHVREADRRYRHFLRFLTDDGVIPNDVAGAAEHRAPYADAEQGDAS